MTQYYNSILGRIFMIRDSDTAISVNGVSKKFKTYSTGSNKGFLASLKRKYYWVDALSDLSFSIKRGEIVALLGKNGSGKSTLIKIIIGILYPDSGSVDVFGVNSWENRKSIAMETGVVLGAHEQLYWDLPAIDAFDLMKYVYGISDKDYKRRLKYFVERLELTDVYKRPVRTLSLGERMKCNFVASVLHLPKLVILDEPTIGVDLSSKAALRETMLEMQKKYDTTFLLTTHIVEDIDVAERIIVLDKGKMIYNGSTKGLTKLFGDKRYVELRFREKLPAALEFGKSIEKGIDYIKIETTTKTLKSKRFISLISDSDVIDYKVSEPDLKEVILKLYKIRGKS